MINSVCGVKETLCFFLLHSNIQHSPYLQNFVILVTIFSLSIYLECVHVCCIVMGLGEVHFFTSFLHLSLSQHIFHPKISPSPLYFLCVILCISVCLCFSKFVRLEIFCLYLHAWPLDKGKWRYILELQSFNTNTVKVQHTTADEIQ